MLTVFDFYILLFTNETYDFFDKTIILIISLSFVLICYFLYNFLDKSLTIEFDDQYLYLTDKIETKAISLTQITSLVMTSIKINDYYSLKVTFNEEGKENGQATFFPRHLNYNLTEFCDNIKKVNKTAKIQTFSFGPFQIDKVNN